MHGNEYVKGLYQYSEEIHPCWVLFMKLWSCRKGIELGQGYTCQECRIGQKILVMRLLRPLFISNVFPKIDTVQYVLFPRTFLRRLECNKISRDEICGIRLYRNKYNPLDMMSTPKPNYLLYRNLSSRVPEWLILRRDINICA